MSDQHPGYVLEIERTFHAPADVLFSVGVHRFLGVPRPLAPRGRLFRFLA